MWWSYLEQMMNYHMNKLQIQNWVNFDFKVKFDLEGQGELPPNIIGALITMFCTFGPNLVHPSSNGS